MCELSGDVVVLGQHEGGDIQLRVFGDEFYARYETLDGYTVVYDTDLGRYCYAILAAGRLTSSGVPVGKPLPDGLRRHLKEDPSVRNELFERRYEDLRPREDDLGITGERTLGPDDGLLEGRKLHEGTVKGLTLLVDFADVRMSITSSDVDRLMNEEGYTDHGNHCSVRDFFLTVSAGKLDYTNVVVGPIQLSKRRSHYINNNTLVPEALQLAVDQHGVDLSDFDSRNEGVVDALNVLYAGPSQYVGRIWPHNSTVNFRDGGVRTHFYQITGAGSHNVDLRIGTICHENGHLLCRFPDMYDYGKRDGDNETSAGIGRYCLMGSGNHLDNGRTPSPVSSYLRYLAGWTDDVVLLNANGTYEARHGAYDQALKFDLGSPNEFFLVENRSRFGLDRRLPAAGLAVYHCDTRGSNEWQDGTRQRHYQCALIQADGRKDLENNANRGDADDLYTEVEQIALSHDTVPNSRRWDGSDSGLTISEISEAGETMTFTIGPPVGPDQDLSGVSFPNALIPDDDDAGVSDVITITGTGAVSRIAMTASIVHTWIGDLTVTLIGPDGSRVAVHERDGGSDDDLTIAVDEQTLSDLGAFLGGPAAGDWTLEVVDGARRDVGRLIEWGLTLGVTEAGDPVTGTDDADLAIPDAESTGIASTITLDGAEGDPAIVVLVDVDIEHSYIGDLQIDLISPANTMVRLHDQDGGGTANLVRRYDSRTAPALDAVVGGAVDGDWTLVVRDLARADVGRLVSWSITVTT